MAGSTRCEITTEHNLINGLNDVCRLCLKYHDKRLHIFDNENDECNKIQTLIRDICSLELIEDDLLPKYVCLPCKKKLFKTREFLTLCEESDKTLQTICKSIFDSKKKSTETSENIKDDHEKTLLKTRTGKRKLLNTTLVKSDTYISDKKKRKEKSSSSTSEEEYTDSNASEIHQDFESITFKIKQEFIVPDEVATGDSCQLPDDLDNTNTIIKSTDIQQETNSNVGNSIKQESTTVVKEELIIPDDLNMIHNLNSSEKSNQTIGSVNNTENEKHETLNESTLSKGLTENKSFSEEQFTCNICHKVYACEQCLLRHSKSHNTENGKTDNLRNALSLKKEINVANDNPSSSRNVNKNFSDNGESESEDDESKHELIPFHYILGELRKECRYLTQRNSFSCKFCTNVYTSKEGLSKHVKAYHPPHSRAEKSISVDTESTVTESSDAKSITNTAKYVCNICKKCLSSASAHQVHMNAHHAPVQFHCKCCKMGFAFKYQLHRHEKTHFQNEPFVCPFCSESFRSALRFKKHMVIHKDESKLSPKQKKANCQNTRRINQPYGFI